MGPSIFESLTFGHIQGLPFVDWRYRLESWVDPCKWLPPIMSSYPCYTQDVQAVKLHAPDAVAPALRWCAKGGAGAADRKGT